MQAMDPGEGKQMDGDKDVVNLGDTSQPLFPEESPVHSVALCEEGSRNIDLDISSLPDVLNERLKSF